MKLISYMGNRKMESNVHLRFRSVQQKRRHNLNLYMGSATILCVVLFAVFIINCVLE